MSAFLEEWDAFLVFALLHFGLLLTQMLLPLSTDSNSVRPQERESPRWLKPSIILILIAALKRCATKSWAGCTRGSGLFRGVCVFRTLSSI